MARYILKRILLMIPTLLIILTVVFLLMRMIPGSPARMLLQGEENVTNEMVEELEEEMGLNDPIPVQWWNYIKDIFTGDWGNSYDNNKPVFERMQAVWEPTLLMTLYATVITVVIAIPAGIYCATHRNSPLDYVVSTLSTATMVIPGFVMGLLLLYVFGIELGWFPVGRYRPIERFGLGEALWSLTLPSFALGLNHVASMARYTRSTMLDVLGQDYIRTAKAKGLSQSKIYYKHALKNTLSIVGTMIAGSIATMLGGAAVTEKVFTINGMGTLAVTAMGNRDYPLEQAIVVFMAMICLGTDLLMDIMYKILDPRIEYE